MIEYVILSLLDQTLKRFYLFLDEVGTNIFLIQQVWVQMEVWFNCFYLHIKLLLNYKKLVLILMVELLKLLP